MEKATPDFDVSRFAFFTKMQNKPLFIMFANFCVIVDDQLFFTLFVLLINKRC